MRMHHLVWLPILGFSVVVLSAGDLSFQERDSDQTQISRTAERKNTPLASRLDGSSWYFETTDTIISFFGENRWGGLKMLHRKSGAILEGSYKTNCNRHIVAEIGKTKGETFDFILRDVELSPDKLTASKADGMVISALRHLQHTEKEGG